MLFLFGSVMLAASMVSPELMLAGKRVRLTPVAEPVLVRGRGELRALALAHGGTATDVLDDLTIVEGARSPAALAWDISRAGAAREVLAVFETEDGTQLYTDRRVRVRFQGHVVESRMRELVARAGATQPKLVSSTRNTFEVLAATPEDAIDVANRLTGEGDVVWANPDFIVRAALAAVPNDPLYGQQWHHEILDSSAAWDLGQGSPSLTIAIIDSGVDVTHPDLADKVVSPRDTLRDVDGAEPAANDAHGTACAGIATAVTNNATGIAGVCPQCSLMPIRVLDQNGFTRVSAGANGMRWAIDHGARVLSNSWGVSPVSDELSEAIEAATAAGLLVLFASGNEGKVVPENAVAAHPAVSAIGATNTYDLLAGYSNTGQHIVLTAPAASVVTDIADRRGYTSGAYYTGFGGTSAATPVVAGLAGLVWSANPSLSLAQLLQLLRDSADRIGNQPYIQDRNDSYGAGRVNARRAMLLATQMPPCVPASEDCANGVDDDCDGLVDTLDPQCAPSSVPLGAACTKDFQCSIAGYCLKDALGFPGGYCSQGCEGLGSRCPTGSVCVGEGFTTGSSCHLACDTNDACRPGYQCLQFSSASSAKACLPSCDLSPCLEGETCNATTGVCEHDGPSAIGDSCATRVDCANNGRCLPDEQGFRDGMCVTECQDDARCPAGTACLQVSVGAAYCLPTCTRKSDCREFYTCHPLPSAAGEEPRGYCDQACLSASDCGYATCNAYGLCGEETPPDITEEPAEDKKDDGGCAATSGSWIGLLVAALIVNCTRGRRVPRCAARP